MVYLLRKFQVNWVRAQDFQLKLFDIAVAWKYSQGHGKWNEQVKLNEQYHDAKFNIYHMNFMVFE